MQGLGVRGWVQLAALLLALFMPMSADVYKRPVSVRTSACWCTIVAEHGCRAPVMRCCVAVPQKGMIQQ